MVLAREACATPFLASDLRDGGKADDAGAAARVRVRGALLPLPPICGAGGPRRLTPTSDALVFGANGAASRSLVGLVCRWGVPLAADAITSVMIGNPRQFRWGRVPPDPLSTGATLSIGMGPSRWREAPPLVLALSAGAGPFILFFFIWNILRGGDLRGPPFALAAEPAARNWSLAAGPTA
ncbi:hypothetical protein FB451DRAFT_1164770 [Mycena latifolia]|nr:hypothetical protein FB451DRAFT_1164770 [Mycena latifolia]